MGTPGIHFIRTRHSTGREKSSYKDLVAVGPGCVRAAPSSYVRDQGGLQRGQREAAA